MRAPLASARSSLLAARAGPTQRGASEALQRALQHSLGHPTQHLLRRRDAWVVRSQGHSGEGRDGLSTNGKGKGSDDADQNLVDVERMLQDEDRLRPPSSGKPPARPGSQPAPTSARPNMSLGLEGATIVTLKQDLKAAGEDATSDDFMDRAVMLVATALHSVGVALTDLSRTNAQWRAAAPRPPPLPAAANPADASPLQPPAHSPLRSGPIASVPSDRLAQRRRKRWWKKNQFPRVPGGVKEPEQSLWSGRLLNKTLALATLFFCCSFNYTLLAATKDALIITAPGAGVEVVPFLMSYGVLPCSVAFMMGYSRMSDALPPHLLFYATCAPLLAFYVLFAFVLFPNAAYLHPHGLADALQAVVPPGLSGLVAMLRYWTFSLFFCACELWGGVVISLLFWSLANEVCSVKEAKTLYPVLGLSANVALIFAGTYLKAVNGALAGAPSGLSLQVLVASVVAGGAGMFLAKSYIDKTLLPPEAASAPKKKQKQKATLQSVLQTLTSSAKIRSVAALVVSYGLCHRLFEVCWKGQLRAAYPSPEQFGAALGDVGTWTGIVTICSMLTGRYVFHYLGWGTAAAATPAVMLVTGGAFFGLAVLSSAGLLTDPALVGAGVAAGVVTQVLARSFKYSLFDPSKEMVYIEMKTKEEKTKGKAAVDLLGSQIGKSGASLSLQAILLVAGGLGAAMPAIGAIFVVMCVVWLGAVGKLNSLLADEAKEAKESKAAAAAALGGGGAGWSAAPLGTAGGEGAAPPSPAA